MQAPHGTNSTTGFGGFLSSLGQSWIASSAPISISSSPNTDDDSNSPSGAYVRKLEKLNQRLLGDIQRLQQEVTRLSEDLEAKGKEAMVTLSDSQLKEFIDDRGFIIVSKEDYRDFFFEKDKNCLGNNNELDELKKTEAKIQHFRETLQTKLSQWKELFNVVISLSEELEVVEQPKDSSVSNIFGRMAKRIQGDLTNIFDQIEPKFKEYEERIKRLQEEVSSLTEKGEEGYKLQEKTAMLKRALDKVVKEKGTLQGELEEFRQTILASSKAKTHLEKENPLQQTVDDQARIIMELQDTARTYQAQILALQQQLKQNNASEFENKVLIENYGDVVEAQQKSIKARNLLVATNEELRERIAILERNYGNIIQQLQTELASQRKLLAEKDSEFLKLQKENDALRKKAEDYDKLKADYDKAMQMLSMHPTAIISQAP